MVKSENELTLYESQLFDLIIDDTKIDKNDIKNYVIKVHEYPLTNKYCLIYYHNHHNQLVQTKDYNINYLEKVLRKEKLKRINAY